MSPSDVEVLLHCHYSLEPHPRVHAEAVIDALSHFQELGVIVTEGEWFKTTDLGAAWVKAICGVPVPRAAFIGTDGKEIT